MQGEQERGVARSKGKKERKRKKCLGPPHLPTRLLWLPASPPLKLSPPHQPWELYQACLNKKLILEDMSWPYLRWDPRSRALVIDKRNFDAPTCPAVRSLHSESAGPRYIAGHGRFRSTPVSLPLPTPPFSCHSHIQACRLASVINEISVKS